MNTIINPTERAKFWKDRLVSHASNYANPKETRREGYKSLFIMDFKQMRAEQETGECAEADGFWSESLRAAVQELSAEAAGEAAAKEPESPYVAKLNSQIVKEKDDDIRILQEALAAAEAECAGWRAIAVDDLETADANDATRARLGLPKIGEGKQ